MRSALLLLALLATQDFATDANKVPDLLRQLEAEDAELRKSAFEEVRKFPDAAIQTRLKKTVQTAGTSWVRKAATERTRAVRTAAVASRKGFNPQEFAGRQKEVVGLLAAGNTKAMEAPVKAMWKDFYFDPSEADKDEKFAAARNRALEAAGWQKTLGVPEKETVEKSLKDALRTIDDNQLFQLLQKRDFKIMGENALLKDKVPVPEYQQAWQVNLYRILIGKPPLRLNSKLCDAAREHSEDMVKHNFFDHTSPLPGKRTPGDRASKHGASASGENIFMGSPSPDSAFWAWFFSLGHHKNMVGDYSEIGVGNHIKHWTQMFG